MRPRNGNTIPTAKDGYPKFVERVEGRIRAAFASLLEAEIARATDELQELRRAAESSDCAALRTAESALRRRVAEAQALIGQSTSQAGARPVEAAE